MADDKVESILKDVDGIMKDFKGAEKNHSEYLHALKTMTNKEANSTKSLKHMKYITSQVLKDMKRLISRKDLSPASNEKLEDAKNNILDIQDTINDMQCDLPAESNGYVVNFVNLLLFFSRFYLKIILGSNLNITLVDADSRYRYKQEYESFKVTVSYIIVVMLFLCYMFPNRALDALCNFLLVWYYCTLTIRESILRVNRSRLVSLASYES